MNELTRNEIIRRWRAGASIRQIARELRLARNTVSRVLARREAQRAGAGPRPRRRPSLLDPYEPVIQELLGRYPDLTAARLLEELRQRGFTGGYTVVRQRLSALRPAPRPSRWSASRRRPAFRPKWIMRSTTSTSPAKAAAASTCSATCWATRGGSTSASSSRRT